MIEIVWTGYEWNWYWENAHECQMAEQCIAMMLGLA